ncbi:(2R)-3-sulfolactate dehydrogenase (NADP(+)) [Variibacter gotjawalensis]|uniref:(2R)-3-sulfolactate dehydrogenase (NADP(+)) n=1 Tax=Variibacter gotjawalensis TaxID=1333996 RepID=A0A0S3Q0V9_9BRAD|nr:Ldh family oxidoreductase [Variibacter gotjawalensis]NIK47671.1 LDH2 family malate/lactate/ureidoglycolate dehydrogenase [Variibacter gotjawalensis]RZS49569.1 LDH2 family malate/lactate/ureidoglycolate dehydrogenase [Variibacter gotjawalensis]BAT61831.1 (2R)-3-sulfolactate dehydrogenase (NADP(+)) [Variibacter gotjawalensis]
MSPSPVDASANRYSTDALTAWAAQVLQSAGVPGGDAVATAEILLRSDMRGIGTHGMARLKSYLERLEAGDFNAKPNIAIDRRGSVWMVDADGALGQVLGRRIVDAASEALSQEAILWVSVRETGHLGALGIFALEAAERGLICFLGQRVPPLLGLQGFHRRALGHNPFAFAAPAADGATPFVIDMACSVAARGHILLAARNGAPIPDGWALDPDGEPTTDSRAAADGLLLPTGGYKGMALAMMIECLAAALPAHPDIKPVMEFPSAGALPRQSAFFLFLNPKLIGQGDAYAGYMSHWMDFYRESGDSARIPGERGEDGERAARTRGLSFSPTIENELRALGDKAGIAFPGRLP